MLYTYIFISHFSDQIPLIHRKWELSSKVSAWGHKVTISTLMNITNSYERPKYASLGRHTKNKVYWSHRRISKRGLHLLSHAKSVTKVNRSKSNKMGWSEHGKIMRSREDFLATGQILKPQVNSDPETTNMHPQKKSQKLHTHKCSISCLTSNLLKNLKKTWDSEEIP